MSLPVDSVDALNGAISDALGGGGSWNETGDDLTFGKAIG